ncbi:dihydroxyacetone kinase family protein [Tessaracoccus sp. ZS01]|uniref:dihydroxyacetone kinase family protein n=1 Tax=Tessaracoccus sp. ZS01 TaxID=1906324 RepID=UPI00096E0FA6|nr:dihydroxyacetone kinase family protein [Tessaracoccus sp. ZS01]MCG6567860.1 DAK2 domain-containing protein [Tessaracoccus sp. ZS01]OMG55345.1 D-erythrulose kinase [Tessaracoccus sp. ZS01]
MTTIYNDPAEFTDEAVAGFVDLYADRVRAVTGGVVRAQRPAKPKVAVLVGGGSGHYPAFAGVVGPGFADGSIIGNLFTSPSASHAYSVGRAAHSGAGVIYTYGNYAGDVMNFTTAGERLQAEGIDARHVIVTDDVASAGAHEKDKRRGIAGDFVVFKVMGAAAERGHDIDEVERLGNHANELTFTVGLAFSGCTFPGADHPHFTVPEGKMGFGLGIHGEPGLRDVDWLPANELADLMVDRLLEERPDGASGRVAPILNGLGSTKYEELFLLWGIVAARLRDHGLELVAPEVGELVTSLDMGGVSLTLCWLDDELEELWLDPADTPAWKRGSLAPEGWATGDAPTAEQADAVEVPVVGSDASRAVAETAVAALERMKRALHDAEDELARIDAVAGDGDHGRGMVRGIDFATDAAHAALADGWGAAGVLAAAGDAWADNAGGTSGVLWGAALRALGAALGNEEAVDASRLADSVEAYVGAMTALGKADVGDKTIIDAAVPFRDSLAAAAEQGRNVADAWAEATAVAQEAADATVSLSPRKGRARPLAERSVGHPDPGAVSFALCVRAVSDALRKEE